MFNWLKSKLSLDKIERQLYELNNKQEEKREVLTKDERIAELFEELFKDDFVDNIDYEKRYLTLIEFSKNKPLIDYFKNRFTRVYKSAIFDRNNNSSEYQKGVFAGRVIELLTLLKDIENTIGVSKDEYLEKANIMEKRKAHFNIKNIYNDNITKDLF